MSASGLIDLIAGMERGTRERVLTEPYHLDFNGATSKCERARERGRNSQCNNPVLFGNREAHEIGFRYGGERLLAIAELGRKNGVASGKSLEGLISQNLHHDMREQYWQIGEFSADPRATAVAPEGEPATAPEGAV